MLCNLDCKNTNCFEHILRIIKFLTQQELMVEATNAGCFILPSLSEPWGVVAHEFAAAGVPLILSSKVGSASAFLIPGFNGHQFESGNSNALAMVMKRVINSSSEDLMRMGNRSHELSLRINSELSSNSLLSIITR